MRLRAGPSDVSCATLRHECLNENGPKGVKKGTIHGDPRRGAGLRGGSRNRRVLTFMINDALRVNVQMSNSGCESRWSRCCLRCIRPSCNSGRSSEAAFKQSPSVASDLFSTFCGVVASKDLLRCILCVSSPNCKYSGVPGDCASGVPRQWSWEDPTV